MNPVPEDTVPVDAASGPSVVPRAARFERPRPRLLAQLTGNMDLPLVVLAAPSGYGKTTLLAQYARSTTRQVAWCRVRGEHEGPADLLDRLARTRPDLSGLAGLDPRTPVEALAHLLAEHLSRLDQGTDLIFDNVESASLTGWLSQVADLLEEGHRLLMSTYATDGLRLARRLAEGRALLLDAADLAFDAGETRAYLEGRGSTLDQGTLLHLAGWPAGLALSAHGKQRPVGADDLVLEALDALSPELLQHLPALAPLDIWNEAGAWRLAPALPAGWLRAVQRAGLPVTALGGGSYQPHQLLTRVLDRLLDRDPLQACQVRVQGAALAEEAGDLRRAFALSVQAGEVVQAIRLAEHLVPTYRDRGEHQLIRSLLETLPLVQLSAALQERLSWSQIETGSGFVGEAHLQRMLTEGALTPSGYACLAMVRGRRGEVQEQLTLAREGLSRVTDGPAVPALSWPLVHAALRLGHHAEAEAAAERFTRWAEQHGDQVRLAEAWQLQGAVWRHTRTPDEAAHPLSRARTLYEQLGWQGRAADVHLAELDLAVQRGQLSGVVGQLGQLERAALPEQHVFHVRRLRLRATAHRRLGQPDLAMEDLQCALAHAAQGGLDRVSSGLTLALADVLAQLHRPAEAAVQLAEVPIVGSPEPLARAVLAALMQGAPLDPDLGASAVQRDAETRLRLTLLCASVGTASDLKAAEAELAVNPHAPYLRHDSALRARLLGSPALALLDGQEASTPPAPASEPTSTICAVTLGDVQATLNGQPLIIGLSKARELLVWLCLHGSGSRDELVTALWDGSGEERHAEYFRVVVRRLRGALRGGVPAGLDPLPYAAGRYRLDPSIVTELDVLGVPGPSWLKPFLPGVDSEWVQVHRSKVRGEAVSALLHQAATGPASVAAPLYRHLIGADPLIAPAHEGLIQLLIAAGDLARARQALQDYRAMLKSEYGAAVPTDFLLTLPQEVTPG